MSKKRNKLYDFHHNSNITKLIKGKDRYRETEQQNKDNELYDY